MLSFYCIYTFDLLSLNVSAFANRAHHDQPILIKIIHQCSAIFCCSALILINVTVECLTSSLKKLSRVRIKGPCHHDKIFKNQQHMPQSVLLCQLLLIKCLSNFFMCSDNSVQYTLALHISQRKCKNY